MYDDPLKGWKPQERIERQYGWVFAWLYPLGAFLNQNLNKPLTPEVRNKIHDIVTAIICQLVISGKYGIQIPHEPREVDMEEYSKKQKNILLKSNGPCDICGESRITHQCHIIPRSEGGPLHRDNFLILCPLHHHLFDHARLTESEWESLILALSLKMESAVIYAKEVRLPLLQEFWNENIDA